MPNLCQPLSSSCLAYVALDAMYIIIYSYQEKVKIISKKLELDFYVRNLT